MDQSTDDLVTALVPYIREHKRETLHNVANRLRSNLDVRTFTTDQLDTYFNAIEIVERMIDEHDAVKRMSR